jgi:hypothetical protein
MEQSYIQRGGGGSATRSSASNVSLGNSHGSAHHHHGGYAHQRGHRSSGPPLPGYVGTSSPSTGRANGPTISPHSDGYLSKGGAGGYAHSSMSDYPHGLSGGWHTGSSASLIGPAPHNSGSNGATRNGHVSSGGHSKRHRGMDSPSAPVQGGPHHDALMELARENLLLKHQLHVATAEVEILARIPVLFSSRLLFYSRHS